MKKSINYTFNYIENCNMCQSTELKILGKRMNCSQGKKPNKKIGISTTIQKCKKCGLVFSNPQPIPMNLQEHYGVPPENYWEEDYFQLDEQYFSSEIIKAKELLSFKNGMKSLDIGAGIGKTMKVLEGAGFDSFGFEPSIPFYERAISKMGLSKDKIRLGMIEEIEYDENSFDFITFGAVLEHLYSPSDCLSKAMKWLKPNGIIHMEIPSSDWLINKITNFYYRIRGLDYVSNISPMHEPYHLYEFGLKSFQEYANANKYNIAFHEYYICKTFLPKQLDFILKPYMKRTKTGMQLCVYLRK